MLEQPDQIRDGCSAGDERIKRIARAVEEGARSRTLY